MYFLEHLGSRWIVCSSQKNKEQAQIFREAPSQTTPSVSTSYTGRMSFSWLFRYWRLESIFWYFDSYDYKNNIGAICIRRDLLAEDMSTCQGRDHIVNILSGQKHLVIVNVPLDWSLF